MRYITGMIGICFYFPIKLTIVGDYILHGFITPWLYIFNKTISPCVVNFRFTRKLFMGISLKTLMKYWQYDYITEKRMVAKLVINDFISGITSIKQYQGKTFSTDTNGFIYAALTNPKLNPNLAKVEIKVIGKSSYFQPMEKALLISPFVFLKNVFNIELYKTLFRIEEIYKLQITVK